MSGRTLKIFVMGNSPNSLRTVEIVNWTGLAFLGERQQIDAIRSRDELSEPGIYLLLSDSSDTDLTDIYIGETDDFIQRIADHAQSKDWWDRFIVFVNKDRNLTKAHVKYLERELHGLAQQSIANLKVRNSQTPGGATLSESDVSAMQEFLSNMRFVLETLGLGYFSSETASHDSIQKTTKNSEGIHPGATEGMEFIITLPKDASTSGENLKALMRVQDGIYVLKSGSHLRKTARDSFASDAGYFALWKQIVESSSVMRSDHPELVVTTKDIEFRSPSAAGSVVRARATNGRTEWRRVSDGEPLFRCQIGGLASNKKAA